MDICTWIDKYTRDEGLTQLYTDISSLVPDLEELVLVAPGYLFPRQFLTEAPITEICLFQVTIPQDDVQAISLEDWQRL